MGIPCPSLPLKDVYTSLLMASVAWYAVASPISRIIVEGGYVVLHGKKVAIVLPAYKAELTLERTYRSIPADIMDIVLLVDDASTDGTVHKAQELGLTTFVHQQNMGYGANQK